MDIDYLLFLQGLRDATGGFFDDLLSKFTTYGEMPFVLMAICVLYWCIDKALGTYVFMGWGLNRVANGFLKVTACVYRPWIRDPRVQPLESAIAKATGYSFPSGHTTNAVALFGGVALRRGISKALRIGLIVIMLLIGFSRNWLGVHTPQDVLVALVVGLALMVLAGRLQRMVEENPEKDLMVAGIGIAVSVALIVYATVKPYPMDYDASGELLVDPVKMAYDSYKNAGWALGFFIGWLIERRFVNFSVEGTMQQRFARAICGLPVILLVNYTISDMIKQAIAGGVGSSIACFVQALFAVLIIPAVFSRFESRPQSEPKVAVGAEA